MAGWQAAKRIEDDRTSKWKGRGKKYDKSFKVLYGPYTYYRAYVI